MKEKEIKISTYDLRKLKKNNNNNPQMCNTCGKCKDRSICNNRKDLINCKKCQNCKDKESCDKYYFTKQSRARVIIDFDERTGKPIYKIFTGKSQEDVYKKIIEFREFVKLNGVPMGINKYEKTIFQVGLELEKDKLNKGKICGNTYQTNIATLNRIKQYKFSTMPIEKVTKKQIDDFLESERIKSNSLIKKDYSMLKRIYDYAIDKHFIKSNFFQGFSCIERPISKKADKEVDALTFLEQKEFEKYIKENECKYRNIFLVLIHTGIRVGECLALNINDVDFESNQIKITKILSRGIEGEAIIQNSSISKTKNGTRQVGINNFFKDFLLNSVKVARENEKNKSKLVFFNENGELLTTTAINSAFKRICEKLKINKDVNTHSLRHTFATRCIEAGVSLPVLQALMGHDKIQTTIDTYGNIYNYYKQSEKQKYIDYLSE